MTPKATPRFRQATAAAAIAWALLALLAGVRARLEASIAPGPPFSLSSAAGRLVIHGVTPEAAARGPRPARPAARRGRRPPRSGCATPASASDEGQPNRYRVRKRDGRRARGRARAAPPERAARSRSRRSSSFACSRSASSTSGSGSSCGGSGASGARRGRSSCSARSWRRSSFWSARRPPVPDHHLAQHAVDRRDRVPSLHRVPDRAALGGAPAGLRALAYLGAALLAGASLVSPQLGPAGRVGGAGLASTRVGPRAALPRPARRTSAWRTAATRAARAPTCCSPAAS